MSWVEHLTAYSDSDEVVAALASLSKQHTGETGYWLAEAAVHIAGLYATAMGLAEMLEEKEDKQ